MKSRSGTSERRGGRKRKGRVTSAARPAPASSARTRRGAEVRQRTRRSASEARQRILEAAQEQLMQVGPEALRLTDLARQLGVSHPAILHHFGSREGLVAAVVRHSTRALHLQLIAALQSSQQATDRGELIELVAKVCGGQGLGRLLAWLLLSGRADKLLESGELPLEQLAAAAHDLRVRYGHPASYPDTLFEVQLLAVVLLGDALFGDAVRQASGVEEGEAAAREFRKRLTQLLPR